MTHYLARGEREYDAQSLFDHHDFALDVSEALVTNGRGTSLFRGKEQQIFNVTLPR
jgi:hypothetical protein